MFETNAWSRIEANYFWGRCTPAQILNAYARRDQDKKCEDKPTYKKVLGTRIGTSFWHQRATKTLGRRLNCSRPLHSFHSAILHKPVRWLILRCYACACIMRTWRAEQSLGCGKGCGQSGRRKSGCVDCWWWWLRGLLRIPSWVVRPGFNMMLVVADRARIWEVLNLVA